MPRKSEGFGGKNAGKSETNCNGLKQIPRKTERPCVAFLCITDMGFKVIGGK